MHCAAYRGHKETAVLLLQNGIDTKIRNNNGRFSSSDSFSIDAQMISVVAGQTALDLAREPQMVQILSVKSVRRVQKTVNRLEGALLRRSRFLGWRPVWVLECRTNCFGR